jgi:hypothetical protein
LDDAAVLRQEILALRKLVSREKALLAMAPENRELRFFLGSKLDLLAHLEKQLLIRRTL